MSHAIIEVDRLCKHYRIGAASGAGADTLRDRIAAVFRRRAEPVGPSRDFWALEDVTFDVRAGEVLGVIGANGAGKSTLLKILSRITEPTKGEVVLRGRVASLLEVGTGFHPELTGRENIYLNGVVLGMRRTEVARKFDEIVAFAGVDRFLDTPVKRYSSGMYVRLAFAVAAHLDPEILIVDEVLAVGDTAFQEKCLGKMHEMASGNGRTVLFVSHNMAAIESLTSRSLYLENGRSTFIGETPAAIQAYLGRARSLADRGKEFEWQARPAWLGERKIDILGGALTGHDNHRVQGRIAFRLRLKPRAEIGGFRLFTKLNKADGQPLGTSILDWNRACPASEELALNVELADPGLAPGHYDLSFFVMTAGGNPADAVLNVLGFDFEPLSDQGADVLAWKPDWGQIRLACTADVAARGS